MSILLNPKTSAILAFFIYGGWSGYCNIEYSELIALKAALIQGLFAFTATLGITVLARYLFNRWGKNKAALCTSFLFCFIILATVPSTIHWLLKTPEIFYSILPGLIWGSLYILGYLIMFHKRAQI